MRITSKDVTILCVYGASGSAPVIDVKGPPLWIDSGSSKHCQLDSLLTFYCFTCVCVFLRWHFINFYIELKTNTFPVQKVRKNSFALVYCLKISACFRWKRECTAGIPKDSTVYIIIWKAEALWWIFLYKKNINFNFITYVIMR